MTSEAENLPATVEEAPSLGAWEVPEAASTAEILIESRSPRPAELELAPVAPERILTTKAHE